MAAQRDTWRIMGMITAASKYASARGSANQPVRRQAPVSNRRQPTNAGAPQILVKPKPGAFVSLDEWFWKELREGGVLRRYLDREVHLHKDKVRAIGRRYQDFRQNSGSDMELLASVPARTYYRWRSVDQDFWADKSNLKSLKRDNPEMTIFV